MVKAMERVYVPYNGERPATLQINGHDFVIISAEREDIERSLPLTGGDRIAAIEADMFQSPEESVKEVAAQVNAHVIIDDGEGSLSEMMRELEQHLPWMH